MRRAGAGLLLVSMTCVDAAPAAPPHCRFARAPVVLCSSAQSAAAAWHLYGFSLSAVSSSNNLELLRQAGCAVGSATIGSHKLLENQSGRVATKWGWTRVALLTVDGRDVFYVAGNYLRGTCELYSSAGASRDARALGPFDPTSPASAVSGDLDTSKFTQTPIGEIGVRGSTFP